MATAADLLIAAWGNPRGNPPGKAAEKRAAEVLATLREHGDVYRLGAAAKRVIRPTPLYLPGDPDRTRLELHATRLA